MRLLVRYYRPQAIGNYATLNFNDVDPEQTHVAKLKNQVFLKLRVKPKHQKLMVRASETSQLVELVDKKFLSEYNL